MCQKSAPVTSEHFSLRVSSCNTDSISIKTLSATRIKTIHKTHLKMHPQTNHQCPDKLFSREQSPAMIRYNTAFSQLFRATPYQPSNQSSNSTTQNDGSKAAANQFLNHTQAAPKARCARSSYREHRITLSRPPKCCGE